MTPFVAPVDDILFSLNTVADAHSLPYWDAELSEQILRHFAAFAEHEIAPLNASGDIQGCNLESGVVRMPDGFADVYRQLAEGGWQGLTAPESFGGMGQNALVAAAVSEVFSGANHSMQMVCNLVPGAISTLLRYGDQAQQQRWIPRLASGDALSTMCLTEPDAGSDLARIRTIAKQSGSDSKDSDRWRVTGEKIFISGGDQNLSEDILHLVLARSAGDGSGGREGINGLSLFLCSKSEAGESIRVTRIEQKLGLHASPTCHMVFDDAPAQLLGEEGAGLKAMFTLMNHARLDVALQGVAHAARAHAISSNYAAQRAQGRKPDGSSAMLSEHADVRRMLDEQKTLAMGARAMAHIALVELERGEQPALVEFLTPLCKVFCSEAGIRCADLGIQVLGGYGYLQEYHIAQTWRDARITAIYEGANGIHELAVSTRGLRTQGGAGADAFDSLIVSLIGSRAPENQEVQSLLTVWRASRQNMLSIDDPTTGSHAFAQLSCELFFRAVWSRIAFTAEDTELSRLYSTVLVRRTH